MIQRFSRLHEQTITGTNTHTLTHTRTPATNKAPRFVVFSFAWLAPHSLSPTPLLLFAKTNAAARQMGESVSPDSLEQSLVPPAMMGAP